MKNDDNFKSPQPGTNDPLSPNTSGSQPSVSGNDPIKTDYQQDLNSQSPTFTPLTSSALTTDTSSTDNSATLDSLVSSNTTNSDNFDSPQTVVSAPHTPEKYGGKKIVATIFGILLLIGAVAIGVTLAQRRQQLQQQATSTEKGWVTLPPTEDKCGLPAGEYTVKGEYYAPFGGHLTTEYRNVSGDNIPHYEGKEIGPGKGSIQISGYWPGSGDVLFGLALTEPGGRISAVSINWYCWGTPTQAPPTETPLLTQTPTPTKPPSATNTPTPKSTPIPTLPPEITAECYEVIAYGTDWNQLSANDLSDLKSGDVVKFAVTGQTSSGTFTKARFSVNNTSIGETSTKKPGSEEFYLEYEIPGGVSSFTIKGEIYHSELGWF